MLALELASPTRFCVFIDHPAGVDHALCVQRHRRAPAASSTAYAIDVSSPGTERPVRKPEHFQRALGRQVALRTEQRDRRLRGKVTRADDDAVTVETARAASR